MIGGFELANKFKEQAEHYGTEFVYDEVLKISKEGDKFSHQLFSIGNIINLSCNR